MTALPAGRPALAEPDAPFDPDGPGAALDPLFRRHAGWLGTVLRLRYGREAAEDLVQETFLRAARQPDLQTLRHPRAWLLRVALNAARDQARRRAARPQPADADAGEACGLPAPACQDEALLLKQVILSLPPPLKEVFLLSRFGGLTYEEIADRLGLSKKTVEWRMTKALALCAARLKA